MYRLGRVPSSKDPRDFKLSMIAKIPDSLPVSYVPVAYMPVMDQGDTPRCVGFSGALTRSIEEFADEKLVLGFDGDELYARCKEIDGAPNEDGTELRFAASVLKDRGALVLASTDQSEVGSFKPIAAYAALGNVDEIKASIVLTGEAWIGADWYNSWFQPADDGTLPAPDSIAGGHAFVFIGYDDTRKAFLMQNSWGSSWSKFGLAWFPYEYCDFAGDFEAWKVADVIENVPTPNPAPVPDPQPVPAPEPPSPGPIPGPKPNPKPHKPSNKELLYQILVELDKIQKALDQKH